jgi:hypothetical protein
VYRFTLAQLPTDAIVAVNVRNVSNDAGGAGASSAMFVEQLTVTATNTLSNLSFAPTTSSQVMLFVNGKMEFAGTSFTLSGQAITWVSGSGGAGYSVLTTHQVIAVYNK